MLGFEVKKQEPDFVQGRRPNKMGLFVGSGGETKIYHVTARGVRYTESLKPGNH